MPGIYKLVLDSLSFILLTNNKSISRLGETFLVGMLIFLVELLFYVVILELFLVQSVLRPIGNINGHI